jgi:putative transposase
MKRSRFTEERIIEILSEHEAGATVADVCRKHGMSSATFYAWKAKFGRVWVTRRDHAARLWLASV